MTHDHARKTITIYDDCANAMELQYSCAEEEHTYFLSVWRGHDSYDDDSRVIEITWYTLVRLTLCVTLRYFQLRVRHILS